VKKTGGLVGTVEEAEMALKQTTKESTCQRKEPPTPQHTQQFVVFFRLQYFG